MASTRNAFDLLKAGGESLQGVASAAQGAAAAKKRKKKGKGGQAAAEEATPIAEPQAPGPQAAPQQLTSAREAGDALEAAAIAAAAGERGALAQDWVDQVGCRRRRRAGAVAVLTSVAWQPSSRAALPEGSLALCLS